MPWFLLPTRGYDPQNGCGHVYVVCSAFVHSKHVRASLKSGPQLDVRGDGGPLHRGTLVGCTGRLSRAMQGLLLHMEDHATGSSQATPSPLLQHTRFSTSGTANALRNRAQAACRCCCQHSLPDTGGSSSPPRSSPVLELPIFHTVFHKVHSRICRTCRQAGHVQPSACYPVHRTPHVPGSLTLSFSAFLVTGFGPWELQGTKGSEEADWPASCNNPLTLATGLRHHLDPAPHGPLSFCVA